MNGSQIVADTDPGAYDYDNESGMIYVNVTNSKQWFGSVNNWVPLDPAHGLTVQREDVDLQTNIGGQVLWGLPNGMSLKKIIHFHNEVIEMQETKINDLVDKTAEIDANAALLAAALDKINVLEEKVILLEAQNNPI